MQKNEEEHKSELTLVKEDLDRVLKIKELLKKDLDTLQKEKSSIEKEHDTLKAGLMKRTENDQKIKKMVEDIQAKSKAVKDELAARKTDSTKWLADLASLNGDMDRKLAESPSSALPLSDSQFIFSLI